MMKISLNSKLKKRIAGFLAGITLLSSVSVPVLAEETDTQETDENSFELSIEGSGYVEITHNDETTTYTASEDWYTIEGDKNDVVGIHVVADTENDYHLLTLIGWKAEGGGNDLNPNMEDEITTEMTIGDLDQLTVQFVQPNDNEEEIMEAAITTSDLNDLPASGEGYLTLHESTGNTYANPATFTLDSFVSGNLSNFQSYFGSGECLLKGNPAWSSSELSLWGIQGLKYHYTKTTTSSGVTITIETEQTAIKNGIWGTNISSYGKNYDTGVSGHQTVRFTANIPYPNKDVYVSVVKNSANKSVTDDNPNYSLKGAVYKVYTDKGCTKEVGTITTDENGNGTTSKMSLDSSITTLYAKEVTASKGYEVCSDIHTITLDSNGKGSFNCTESILIDPASITLYKIGESNVSDAKSLNDAEFTIKYYAVDTNKYNSADDVKDLTPTKTWTIKTKSSEKYNGYVARLNDEMLVAGDELYKVNSSSDGYLPLGVITIEETKAPTGYTTENSILTVVGSTVASSKDGIVFMKTNDLGRLETGNEYTVVEEEVRNGFTITKQDTENKESQGDATSLKAGFKIVNNNDYTVAYMDANKNVVATAEANSEFKTSDGFTFIVYTDDNGNFTSSDCALMYGNYTISEVEGPANYKLSEQAQKITVSDSTTKIALTFTDLIYKGGFKVQKHDAYTSTKPEGGSDLLTTFKLVNKSTKAVVVKGVTYKPNETIMTFTTDAKGYYETATDLLPYGTYELTETEAPKNYTNNGSTTTTFTIREDGQMVDLTDKVIVNEPKLAELTVHKVTDYEHAGSSWSENEQGAIFAVVLKSYVVKYGSVEAALAKQYGVSESDITNREWLNANLFADTNTAVTTNIDGSDTNKMTAHEYAIVKTDKDGNATTGKNLVMGEYVVKQIASPNDEIAVNKSQTSISFSEDGETKHVESSNTNEVYYLGILKQDSSTGETVSYHSADFKIYQLDTLGNREYVTMTVGKKTYDTFRTVSENGKIAENDSKKIPTGTFYVEGEDEDGGTVVTPLTVSAGTYYIEEVNAPEGYVLADDVKVVIAKQNISTTDEDGNQFINVIVKDQPISGTLNIEKNIEEYTSDTDLVEKDAISQIRFTLYAAEDIIDPATGKVVVKKGGVAKYTNGVEIGEISLDKNGKATIKGIMLGKYELKETTVPTSLAKNDTAYKVEFVQADDDQETSTYKYDLKIENKVTKVEVSKTDITGESELVGAKLQVIDTDGNVIDEWTSTKNVHMITGLKRGTTYTLRETQSPNDEYAIATDIQFIVNEDGSTTKVTMIDKYVEMSKVDVGGKEVEGAKMVVKDSQGNVVDSWTSGKDAHKIKNLIEGHTYTLHEEVAVKGYVQATDIEFTVSSTNEKGEKENQHIEMVDTRVDVSKVDVAGKEVEGAQMSVTDADGKVVDSWTSGKETHYVSGLVAGQTYTIHENVASEGYVIANDITFTASATKDLHYDVVDKRVSVSKVDVGGDEVVGATLTITDTDGNVVDTWQSTNETHYASGLRVGQTYTLTETNAPAGYVKAEKVEFTVTDDGVDQAVEMVDTIERVAKLDENGNYVSGATLQAVDADGNVIDQWVSGQHIVDLTDDEISKLKKGKTVETSLTNGAKATVTPIMIDNEVSYQVAVQGRGISYYDIDLEGDETTHRIMGLVQGQTYTVKEIGTPDGYYVANDVTITPIAGEDHLTKMVDNTINYKISKIDDKGNAVAGVTLQLFDITDSENPVEIELPNDGVTTEEPFELSNILVAGHTYRLDESNVIGGYYAAQSIEFQVQTKGTAEYITITMVDATTDVSVLKVDKDMKPLAGAKMQVFEATVIDEATKDESMLDDDAYSVDSADASENADDEIAPLDEDEASKPIVDETDDAVIPSVEQEATKDDTMLDDEAFNAEADETVNTDRIVTTNGVTYELGNLVYEFTSGEEAEDISQYVEGGKTYILREVSAPWGYEEIEDEAFTVTGGMNNAQVIIATDLYETVYVTAKKVDADDNSKVLAGAEFTIYKADGTIAKDINGQDCVGITGVDGLYTFELEYEPGMEEGTYFMRETGAPQGYRINKNSFGITFSSDYDFAKENPIIVEVSDEAYPVRSGVAAPIAYGISGLVALGAIGGLAKSQKKKKEESEE